MRSMSRYGWISLSLISPQMIRVISSPSISTTGFATLIFAMAVSHLLGQVAGGIRGTRAHLDAAWQLRAVYNMSVRRSQNCYCALRLTELAFGRNRVRLGHLSAPPARGTHMTTLLNRRNLLAIGGSVVTTGAVGL